jgi:hypothetical protein
MKLAYNYTKKDTTFGIISITKSQSGDTITTIYGDIITDIRKSGNKIVHHSFRMYDIPISLGYEKRLKNWVLGGELGGIININATSSGHTLTNDTSFTSVMRPITYFKNNFGLSYFGGLSIGHDFGNLGRFAVTARYRVNPSSFASNQNNVSQQYRFFSLNLGYFWLLN